jgi:hypothetical protein
MCFKLSFDTKPIYYKILCWVHTNVHCRYLYTEVLQNCKTSAILNTYVNTNINTKTRVIWRTWRWPVANVCVISIQSIAFCYLPPPSPPPPAVALSLPATRNSLIFLFVIVAVGARLANKVLLLVFPLHFDSWYLYSGQTNAFKYEFRLKKQRSPQQYSIWTWNRSWQNLNSVSVKDWFCNKRQIYVCDIWYDIFDNCNWVDTQWQWYSTHLQANNTQNNTINNKTIRITNKTTQKTN